HISTTIPKAMHEGASGTLFESQSNGTWRYDYFANNGLGQWTQLTVWPASTLSAAQDNTFVGSYSTGLVGTDELDKTGWHKLTPLVAKNLAVASDNHVYGGYTNATCYYDGVWHEIASAAPNAMDASPGGALFASYANGTWEYNPAVNHWTQLSPNAAK